MKHTVLSLFLAFGIFTVGMPAVKASFTDEAISMACEALGEKCADACKTKTPAAISKCLKQHQNLIPTKVMSYLQEGCEGGCNRFACKASAKLANVCGTICCAIGGSVTHCLGSQSQSCKDFS
jgi:hypothetical protein